MRSGPILAVLWLAGIAATATSSPAHAEETRQLAYDSSGRWLVAASDTTVRAWSVDDGKRMGLATIERGITTVRASPKEAVVAILGNDETVELRTLPALKPLRSWPTGNEYGTVDLAFSHDGAALATCADSGRLMGVLFRNPETGESTGELRGKCHQIAFSPDGRWLASAGLNGTQPEVRLWRLDDRARAWIRMPYPEGAFFQLAFSSDSKLLLAGWRAPIRKPGEYWLTKYEDRYHYWRVPGGEPAFEAGGPAGVETVTLGTDPGSLLSAEKGTVRIWSLANAAEREGFEPRKLEFEAHAGPIRALAPSPDLATFATAGRDGAVRIWRLSDGSTVRELVDPAQTPKPVQVAATTPPKPSAGDGAPSGSQKGLVITGRLVFASGEPVARRNLKLPFAQPDERGGLLYVFAPEYYEANTDENGSFRFTGIKSGKKYALVDVSSGRPSPLLRPDGSTVILDIAEGAQTVDLGEIRFAEP